MRKPAPANRVESYLEAKSLDLLYWQRAEKRFGMLREPQHGRRMINDINPPPFVLSTVEGLREGFFC